MSLGAMGYQVNETEIIQPKEPGRRRRFSPEEKYRMVEETRTAGNSLSSVARRYGIAPSQLFQWRKLMEDGATAGLRFEDQVVPVSAARALQAKVRHLEQLLGKKTMEVEILKEAVQIAREKKLISRMPLLGVDGFR